MPSSGSTVLTLLKSENDNFSLRIRKNSHDQYVPQVYVNGSDVTPGMEGLWRVLLPGVWNHLVVRYSSSDQRLGLYLNGAQVAVFTGVPAITSNDNFYLGGTTQSVDYWVDDLRLFNRPISVLDLNRLAERTVLQMQMDGSGFPDSSVYNQTVSQRNTPHQIGGSVRGSSLQAGSGSSLGYLKVNGNDLLNMQDGAFSFAAWIYPTSGGTGNDWEGIFGYDSGTSTAYPVLERKGARLRFGFGDGSSFVSKEVTADVLNLNQWNHVVVNFQPEFDLNGVSTGNYLYKLYVDSTAVDSNIFTTKPHADSGKTLFVGHSSKSMTVTVNDLYVDGIRGDAGDWAEVWMERYVDGGFQNCFWPTTDCDDEQDVQGTNTYSVNYSTSYADYQSVRIEVWEDDWGANPNDHAGDANYYWYDLPGYNSWYMSDGISGYLHTTLSRPSTQFFGYIDELEVYRYGLDSEQVFDLYNAIPITARLPLDDRPASDSFDNRAFIGELDNGVCTEPACPAAGTVGLINQDVTFDGADDLITVPMVSTTPDYMVSLWLLSSCLNCGVYTLEDAAHTALSQIYLKNGNVCVKTGATEMCTQGNGFTNEQWHHVVYANNGSVANLWLDGSVVNTISGGATLPSSPGGFATARLRP